MWGLYRRARRESRGHPINGATVPNRSKLGVVVSAVWPDRPRAKEANIPVSTARFRACSRRPSKVSPYRSRRFQLRRSAVKPGVWHKIWERSRRANGSFITSPPHCPPIRSHSPKKARKRTSTHLNRFTAEKRMGPMPSGRPTTHRSTFCGSVPTARLPSLDRTRVGSCGIPDVLYTDNGCDFTSSHLEQLDADLKIRLVFSIPGKPRGRGRIERRLSGQSNAIAGRVRYAVPRLSSRRVPPSRAFCHEYPRS